MYKLWHRGKNLWSPERFELLYISYLLLLCCSQHSFASCEHHFKIVEKVWHVWSGLRGLEEIHYLGRKESAINLEGACASCAKQPSKDDDALGCVWCDRVQHRECFRISVDQYSVFPHNIIFFLLPVYQSLRIHLKDELNSMAAKIGSSVEELKSSIVKSKVQWNKG